MTMFRTAMWEALAATGTSDELLSWALHVAQPELLATDPQCAVQVFRSADDRVVIIATGSNAAPGIAAPPERLLQRPPHRWTFEKCDVSTLQPPSDDPPTAHPATIVDIEYAAGTDDEQSGDVAAGSHRGVDRQFVVDEVELNVEPSD
jgi:hypothetical protein